MSATRISEETFKPFGKIVSDFLSETGPYSALFPPRLQIKDIADAIRRRQSFETDRISLTTALTAQYKAAGIDPSNDDKLNRQLNHLNDQNCFTVTTGHQLCLLTGPYYFIIKILQAIKLADELNKQFDQHHFVPVFWMASEDHDFQEINHFHLFNKTFVWDDEQGGMTGDYSTTSLQHVLNEVISVLGEGSEADRLKAAILDAYDSGHNLANASRRLIHDLFGERGLVIIDGNDKTLKKTFAPHFQKEISEQLVSVEVGKVINEIGKEYAIQANPREINMFYLDPGRRDRIKFENDQYFTDGGKQWSEDELLKEIADSPENFSPNVLLRPIYQEVILPNLVYIGGPGEVAYWMQLRKAFEAMNVFLPMVNLRNNIMWLDKHKLKKLKKLELEITDVFLDEPAITKKLVKYDEFSDEINEEIKALNDAVSTIADKTATVDESVKAFVLAEGRRIEKSVEQIIKRFIKAKKHKNEEAVNAYWNVHEKLFPNDSLHERYDNFVPYYLQHGDDWFSILYDVIDPEDARLIAIQEPTEK